MNFLIDGQEPVFADLAGTIREGNALAFVGSGISKHAGYPLWSELVGQLAQAAHIPLTAEDQNADGSRQIDIIQQCRDRLSEDEYYDALRMIFDPAQRDPFSLMHLEILEMPFVSFPTTNIDNCHVLAKENIHQKPIEADWDVYPKFKIHHLDHRRIYYLHGKIENGDKIKSVVLSASEYQRAYDPKKGDARAFLLYALRWFDCIFIGYSMSDPFMTKVMEEAVSIDREEREELDRQGRPRERLPKHYAILPYHVAVDGRVEAIFTRGRPLKPEEIDRLELQRLEREKLLKQLRISPLYYRVINDVHSSLNHLIHQLNRQLVVTNTQVPT